MADTSRIESIYGISSSSSKIDSVRRYTSSERKQKMEEIEAQIREHEEMTAIHREIEKKYPNKEKLSFKQLLENEKNNVQSKESFSNDDEEGFILSIKSSY